MVKLKSESEFISILVVLKIMIKKTALILILFYTILQSASLAQLSNDWQLTKNEKGVKIYLRKKNNSQYKEVLGLTSIKTSLSALVLLVKDADNHHQWIYANKNAKLLKSISDFEWIYYNESEAPWPVSNRDLITHARMSQDGASLKVVIDSQGIPKYIPEKPGLVRMPKLHTVWEFTPKNNGFIDVRFELELDLGGNIPAWLVNFSIDNGPLQTLQKMAVALQQNKYKNAQLPYLKEKSE